MFLISEAITDWALATPTKAFVIEHERQLTFAEFDQLTRRRANDFLHSGIQPGDRIVVVAPNAIETVVAYAAVLRAGAVLVPVSHEVRVSRLRTLVEDCLPRAIIAPSSILTHLRDAPSASNARLISLESLGEAAVSGSCAHTDHLDHGHDHAHPHADTPSTIDRDIALIVYTSGSSGEPKGVMLTHANLVNSTAAIAQYLAQSERDVVGCALPIAFSYGLFQVLTALRMGSTLVLERSFAFPFETLRSIAQHRVTMLPAVPTMIARLIELLTRTIADSSKLDLSSLRCVTNAAAALPPIHALRLSDLLPDVALHLMYGQTECTRACTLPPALVRTHAASVGGAIPNSEVYLIDAAGQRLPFGSEGELVVRGANVMRGYWRKEQATAACLVAGEHQGEKVLRTGDRFRSDAAGMMTFVARADEIFKCRGEKVAPAAIEHVLCELAGVCDAAVIGVEHPEDGTAIHAFIVVKEGCVVEERAVRAFCKGALESAFMPRFIEFRASLPRTSSGKLQRRALLTESDAGVTAPVR